MGYGLRLVAESADEEDEPEERLSAGQRESLARDLLRLHPAFEVSEALDDQVELTSDRLQVLLCPEEAFVEIFLPEDEEAAREALAAAWTILQRISREGGFAVLDEGWGDRLDLEEDFDLLLERAAARPALAWLDRLVVLPLMAGVYGAALGLVGTALITGAFWLATWLARRGLPPEPPGDSGPALWELLGTMAAFWGAGTAVVALLLGIFAPQKAPRWLARPGRRPP